MNYWLLLLTVLVMEMLNTYCSLDAKQQLFKSICYILLKTASMM